VFDDWRGDKSLGKHDKDRDGHGVPQPDRWENWGDKCDQNKHENGDESTNDK
jgi:hypothetical protein